VRAGTKVDNPGILYPPVVPIIYIPKSDVLSPAKTIALYSLPRLTTNIILEIRGWCPDTVDPSIYLQYVCVPYEPLPVVPLPPEVTVPVIIPVVVAVITPPNAVVQELPLSLYSTV